MKKVFQFIYENNEEIIDKVSKKYSDNDGEDKKYSDRTVIFSICNILQNSIVVEGKKEYNSVQNFMGYDNKAFKEKMMNKLKDKIPNIINYGDAIYYIKIYKKCCFELLLEKNISSSEKLKINGDILEFFDELELIIFEIYSANKAEVFLGLDTLTKLPSIYLFIYTEEKILYMSKNAKNLFGCNDEEEKFTIQEVLSDDSNIFNENNKNYEMKVLDKNNNEVWMQFNFANLKLRNNNVIIAIGYDVSQRKKIEKDFKESEEKYKILLEMLPDSVFVYNDKGIDYANNAAVNLMGADDVKELIGKNNYNFLEIPSEYQSIIQQQNDILNRRGKLSPSERKYIRKKDGKVLEVEVTSAVFYDKGERLTINITRDIEERNKVNQLKEKIRDKTLKLKEAKRYDELRNEFFANISHELRTPITVIWSALQVLANSVENNGGTLSVDSVKNYITITKQNCYRLIRLVNNLIDITKIDAGYMELNLKKYNIVELVENVTMSVAAYVESKGLELIFDTDIEEKYLYVDPDKIERIILNLLSNAVKFTKAGGKLEVTITNMDKAVNISVKDTGIGIPEEKQRSVFQRFVQVDRTLSRDREGSGIGLSLVQSFVEIHKGKIELKSKEGYGSEFIIELPQYDIEEKDKNLKNELIRSYKNIELANIEFSDIYAH